MLSRQRLSIACPRCGTGNRGDVRFCSRCETPLGGGVDIPQPELVLASRSSRLLAKTVDAPFTMASLLVASVVPGEMPASEAIQIALIVSGVFGMIVQLVLLSSDGQTIGKRLLKIKVIRVDSGRNGGFVANVLLRAVVNGLLSLTIVYFVVDVLFIFFGNRLCLHDYIAGTRVVRAFDARAPVRTGREARRRTR
jgi:uncharacterized RDD family membrane protein YckC